MKKLLLGVLMVFTLVGYCGEADAITLPKGEKLISAQFLPPKSVQALELTVLTKVEGTNEYKVRYYNMYFPRFNSSISIEEQ